MANSSSLSSESPEQAQAKADTDLRAAIRKAIDATVRSDSDGDVNAVVIRQRLSRPDISNERVTAALRGLASTGLLYEDRKAKVVGNDSAKDRKIIQYRATDVYKRLLGLIEAPPPATNPVEMMRSIHAYVDGAGFVCSLQDVTNYFLCLQAKPFVILSGISGTGKTRLPRLVAEAMDSAHQLIPVKPNWSDNSDLMGYYSVTQDRFVTGQMLEAIRAALDDPARPHFVVLDEMNLAHVEHYLSDLLSVMETRRKTASGEIITDRIPLDLPSGAVSNQTPSGSAVATAKTGHTGSFDVGVEDPAELVESLENIRLPWNLFLIGTVNVDETTHPFSRKVLDRAYTIDYNDVDLTHFGRRAQQGQRLVAEAMEVFLRRPLSVQEVYGSAPDFFDEIAKDLTVINASLQKADMHFAYRVRDEIALYMWAWRSHQLEEVLSRDDAFDNCLLQKILPRCQGSSDTARQALEAIFRFASVTKTTGGIGTDTAPQAGDPSTSAPTEGIDAESRQIIDPRLVVEPQGAERWRFPRTARKSLAMLRRYVDTGYFAFWS